MSHTRPSKASGNALIAVSGGAGSMALFDLLTDDNWNYVGKKDAGLVEKKRGAKEPIWERGTVVYVEFCRVVDGAMDRTEEIKAMAEERGMNFIGLRAEDVFDPELGGKLGRAIHKDQVFADLSHPGEFFLYTGLTYRLAYRILVDLAIATRVAPQSVVHSSTTITSVTAFPDSRSSARPRCQFDTQHISPTTWRDIIKTGRTHHLGDSTRSWMGSTSRTGRRV
jgi:hypothetical protein